MANEKFSIKEALQYGWDAFKANVSFFIGFMVVMLLITLVPDAIVDKIFEPKSAGLFIAKIVLRLIGLILGMIATRISLDIHDSGKPNLSKLTDLMPQLPSYIGGKLIYGIGVILPPALVGLLLFLFFGIITISSTFVKALLGVFFGCLGAASFILMIMLAYMFLYVGYLIIDRYLGPIDALQESRALTDGYKMDLFLFSLAVAGVNIVGVICLFVGLFVTIPVTLMASVYVYRKLSPAEATLVEAA